MSDQTHRTVLIAAGGTGGHVFPGVAIAHALKAHSVNVVWLGSKGGMEQAWIEKEQLPLYLVSVKGLRGKSLMLRLQAFFNFFWAYGQALEHLRAIRPHLVLCMGGFVSAPVGLAARTLGIPLVLHEQNAIAGMTNRILSYIASKVFLAFQPTRGICLKNAIFTGNPVREAIRALVSPSERFSHRSGALVVLVLGGSRGAQALNEKMPLALQQLNQPLHVIHQCGGGTDPEIVRRLYQNDNVQAEVFPFIDDMAAVYEKVDCVICRSGALTISELMVAGLPSILVPYPHAVDDHQTVNAQILLSAGAAYLWQQHEPLEKLVEQLRVVMNRTILLEMANRARSLACVNTIDVMMQQFELMRSDV